MTKKNKIRTFEGLLMYMYEGFPNTRVGEEIVHEIVITTDDRNLLLKQKYLLREGLNTGDGKGKWIYGLGPNALHLITAWKTEKLTKDLNYFTILLFVLTVVLAVMAVMQYLANF